MCSEKIISNLNWSNQRIESHKICLKSFCSFFTTISFQPGNYNGSPHGANDIYNFTSNVWGSFVSFSNKPAVSIVGGIIIKRYDQTDCEVFLYSNLDNKVYWCR